MLDWNEYVSQLITQSSSLDGISLSLGDLSKPVGIPPIIKASIFMLDRMQEKQGKFGTPWLLFSGQGAKGQGRR